MSTIFYRSGEVEYNGDSPIAVNTTPTVIHEYVVRLITDHGGRKECIAEEVFSELPIEAQIVWCLLKYPTATFASVIDRYRICEESDLPFA